MYVDCTSCGNLKCYRGTTDRYGVPQEPDDYECGAIEKLTDEELDRYFCDGEKWDDSIEGAGCSEYTESTYGPYIDDYDNRF